MVQRIRRIRTTEDYGALLKIIYGFYAPLEKRVGDVVPPQDSLQVASRRKASLILDDLGSMGVDACVPVCDELPGISSYHQALGVLYVLEGSTLGGAVISQMIARQLGPSAENGIAFFMGYRDKTVQMWEEFKKHLSAPFSEAEQAEVIGSAQDTFLTFRHWIEKNG